MKPGYKTTEFGFTAVLQIVGLLVMLGVFTPEQQDAITVLVGAVIMVLSSAGYAVSRGLAKRGTAVATVNRFDGQPVGIEPLPDEGTDRLPPSWMR